METTGLVLIAADQFKNDKLISCVALYPDVPCQNLCFGAFYQPFGNVLINENDLSRSILCLTRRLPHLNTVRELMGHADMKMTLRYAHLASNVKMRAVEMLDEDDDYEIDKP
jgi:hypothetical protein